VAEPEHVLSVRLIPPAHQRERNAARVAALLAGRSAPWIQGSGFGATPSGRAAAPCSSMVAGAASL